jgi:hypothetical protein
MFILLEIFPLEEDEQRIVKEATIFLAVFYVKYWFTTPLASAAARNDLEFMSKMKR